MSVLVCTDFSVWKCSEKYYTKFAFFSIIKRYNENFGELSLCCSIKAAETPPDDFIDISDIVKDVIECTKVFAILNKKDESLKNAILHSDIVICRFAGFIPIYAANLSKKLGIPVFSEVMSCGWDAFWNHGILGKIVAPYVYFGAKKALRKSDYALYVTEDFLQNRYPCENKTVGVSDVVIPDIDESVRERRIEKIKHFDKKQIVLMTCAAVNVWYKGQHYVIKAIPLLNKIGIRIKYYCVGQGENTYLKKIAKKYKVEDQVVFTGAVTHDRIFELLDECDVYIQPSLQEGLPRALVEAMSRGCPAIGARTGGIPELLPEECVVKRKSVTEIASAIKKMVDEGLGEYSVSSFKRASDFQKVPLDERRNLYFAYINEQIRASAGE